MKIAFISSSVTLVTMQKLDLALFSGAIELSVSTVVSVETKSEHPSGAITFCTLPPPHPNVASCHSAMICPGYDSLGTVLFFVVNYNI